MRRAQPSRPRTSRSPCRARPPQGGSESEDETGRRLRRRDPARGWPDVRGRLRYAARSVLRSSRKGSRRRLLRGEGSHLRPRAGRHAAMEAGMGTLSSACPPGSKWQGGRVSRADQTLVAGELPEEPRSSALPPDLTTRASRPVQRHSAGWLHAFAGILVRQRSAAWTAIRLRDLSRTPFSEKASYCSCEHRRVLRSRSARASNVDPAGEARVKRNAPHDVDPLESFRAVLTRSRSVLPKSRRGGRPECRDAALPGRRR